MNTPKTIMVAGLLGATSLLAACDDSDRDPTPEEQNAYVDEEAGSQTRARMQQDDADLKQTLAELQSKDPSVKDAYFTYDAQGNRQLHIVQEKAEGGFADSVLPVALGVGAGYLLAKAISNSGGYSSYPGRPQSYQSLQDEEERRRHRNTGYSSYASTLMTQNRSAIRSSPNFRSQVRSSPAFKSSSGLSSKSTGVFSSGSSARSSAHSSGGFGG